MTNLPTDRSFEVWAYTVSLGRLLLRSVRYLDGSPASSNVDVTFIGVVYVEVACSLGSIGISEASRERAEAVLSRYGRPLQTGEHVFSVSTHDQVYALIASGWRVEVNNLGRMESGLTNAPRGQRPEEQ